MFASDGHLSAWFSALLVLAAVVPLLWGFIVSLRNVLVNWRMMRSVGESTTRLALGPAVVHGTVEPLDGDWAMRVEIVQ